MAFKTSEVLRHVMAERQLTQTDLARELGVRPQSVQQWVSGKTRPAGKNLEALSVYLGLSPAVITTGTTEGRTTVDLEDGTISIPRFSVYGSCGTGYPNEFPKVMSMVQTTRDWLEAKCPGHSTRPFGSSHSSWRLDAADNQKSRFCFCGSIR